MKRKTTSFLVSLLMLISLSTSAFVYGNLFRAQGQSTTDSWPMFRHDLAHSGSSSSAAPRTNQTLWKFNTGGQGGSPTAVDGVVYVGSYDRNILPFRAFDGAQLWTYSTGGVIGSPP